MRTLLIAVLVLGLLLPGAASGETVGRFGNESGAAGPVLSGGRVLWSQVAGADQRQLLRASGPNGPSTVAIRPRATASYTDPVSSLAASPDHLAWLTQEQEPGDKYGPGPVGVQALLAGPASGPLLPQPACDRPEIALTGSLLVTSGRCGSDFAAQVAVTDLDTGRPTASIALSPRDASPAVTAAGDVVAYVADDGAHVVSARSGAALAAYPSVRASEGLVLLDDGSMVVSDTDGALTLLTPDGRSRPLGTGVVYRGAASGRVVAVARGPVLSLLDVDTAATHDVARLAAGVRPDAVAFDGARVAWRTTECEAVSIHVTDADAATLPAEPTASCFAPRLVSPHVLTIDRRGDIRIRVRCARRCRGTVALVGEEDSDEPDASAPLHAGVVTIHTGSDRARVLGSDALVFSPRSTTSAVRRAEEST